MDVVATAIVESFEQVLPPLVRLIQGAEDAGYTDLGGHFRQMFQTLSDLIAAARIGDTARALELMQTLRNLTEEIVNKNLGSETRAEIGAALESSIRLIQMGRLFLSPEPVVAAFLETIDLVRSSTSEDEAPLVARVNAWWESGPDQDPVAYFKAGVGLVAAGLASETAAHLDGGFQFYSSSFLGLWSCEDDAGCAGKECGKKFGCTAQGPTISACLLNPEEEGSLKLAALVLARQEGKEDLVKEAIEKIAKELVEKNHRVYVYVKAACFCCRSRYCCFFTGTYKSYETVVTDWLNIHPEGDGGRAWVKTIDYSDSKDLAEKAAKRIAARVAEEDGKACP